jgi:hypothetical protein
MVADGEVWPRPVTDQQVLERVVGRLRSDDDVVTGPDGVTGPGGLGVPLRGWAAARPPPGGGWWWSAGSSGVGVAQCGRGRWGDA